jgi:hypothetical protein
MLSITHGTGVMPPNTSGVRAPTTLYHPTESSSCFSIRLSKLVSYGRRMVKGLASQSTKLKTHISFTSPTANVDTRVGDIYFSRIYEHN